MQAGRITSNAPQDNSPLMDPVSQGILGCAVAQNTCRTRHLAAASVLGIIGGMAPDLDVLIRSESDPLLFLKYHRQFTHSLIFIPAGGLICALLTHWLAKRWLDSFRQTFLYCTAGYASHGLLDACTSYGTQLLWPFSDARIGWNNISIIDPLFTLPLIVLVLVAVRKRSVRPARLAVAWALVYLGLGMVQKERAEETGYRLAATRGHDPVRLEAKPGIGSLLLWKVIYEIPQGYHVDGVRTGIRTTVYEGNSIRRLDLDREFPWLDPQSTQFRDIERFRWFSDGFVSPHPTRANRIIDMRYSVIVNEIDPLWMIELDPERDPGAHVAYIHEHRTPPGAGRRILGMLLGP